MHLKNKHGERDHFQMQWTYIQDRYKSYSLRAKAYISVNANPYSDGHALQAIRLIGRALKKAVENGNDKQARIDMAYGSYIAGLSFFNAGVGAIHALAYPLGGQFHLAHVESNAVLIPYVLRYIRRSCSTKLATILQAVTGEYYKLNEEEASLKCIEVLAAVMKDIGIPQTLDGFNIPSTAIKAMATDCIQQKRLLTRCPMALTEKDIFQIYEAASFGLFVEAKEKSFDESILPNS